MFLKKICVNLWKKFKNEFSFISYEQDMRNRIYDKVWFVKQSCVIVIYPNFYTFYHKAKWWLDAKDDGMSFGKPRFKPCY